MNQIVERRQLKDILKCFKCQKVNSDSEDSDSVTSHPGSLPMLALHPGNPWWNHPSLYKLFFRFDIIQMIGNLPNCVVE